jgi:hypothetical protein
MTSNYDSGHEEIRWVITDADLKIQQYFNKDKNKR